MAETAAACWASAVELWNQLQANHAVVFIRGKRRPPPAADGSTAAEQLESLVAHLKRVRIDQLGDAELRQRTRMLTAAGEGLGAAGRPEEAFLALSAAEAGVSRLELLAATAAAGDGGSISSGREAQEALFDELFRLKLAAIRNLWELQQDAGAARAVQEACSLCDLMARGASSGGTDLASRQRMDLCRALMERAIDLLLNAGGVQRDSHDFAAADAAPGTAYAVSAAAAAAAAAAGGGEARDAAGKAAATASISAAHAESAITLLNHCYRLMMDAAPADDAAAAGNTNAASKQQQQQQQQAGKDCVAEDRVGVAVGRSSAAAELADAVQLLQQQSLVWLAVAHLARHDTSTALNCLQALKDDGSYLSEDPFVIHLNIQVLLDAARRSGRRQAAAAGISSGSDHGGGDRHMADPAAGGGDEVIGEAAGEDDECLLHLAEAESHVMRLVSHSDVPVELCLGAVQQLMAARGEPEVVPPLCCLLQGRFPSDLSITLKCAAMTVRHFDGGTAAGSGAGHTAVGAGGTATADAAQLPQDQLQSPLPLEERVDGVVMQLLGGSPSDGSSMIARLQKLLKAAGSASGGGNGGSSLAATADAADDDGLRQDEGLNAAAAVNGGTVYGFDSGDSRGGLLLAEVAESCFRLLFKRALRHFQSIRFSAALRFCDAAAEIAGLIVAAAAASPKQTSADGGGGPSQAEPPGGDLERHKASASMLLYDVFRLRVLCCLALQRADDALRFADGAEAALTAAGRPPSVVPSFFRLKAHLERRNVNAALQALGAMSSCADFQPELLSVACQEAMATEVHAVAKQALLRMHELCVQRKQQQSREPRSAAEMANAADGFGGDALNGGSRGGSGGGGSIGCCSEATILRMLLKVVMNESSVAIAAATAPEGCADGDTHMMEARGPVAETRPADGGSSHAVTSSSAAAAGATLTSSSGSASSKFGELSKYFNLVVERLRAVGAAAFFGCDKEAPAAAAAAATGGNVSAADGGAAAAATDSAGAAQAAAAATAVPKWAVQLEWFAFSAWNYGLDVAQAAGDYQACSVLMATCGALIAMHPAVAAAATGAKQLRHSQAEDAAAAVSDDYRKLSLSLQPLLQQSQKLLSTRKLAYMLSGAAALEVHRQRPAYAASLGLAARMTRASRAVGKELAEAAAAAAAGGGCSGGGNINGTSGGACMSAAAPGDASLCCHARWSVGGAGVTGPASVVGGKAEAFLLAQEFEVATRQRDTAAVMEVLKAAQEQRDLPPHHLIRMADALCGNGAPCSFEQPLPAAATSGGGQQPLHPPAEGNGGGGSAGGGLCTLKHEPAALCAYNVALHKLMASDSPDYDSVAYVLRCLLALSRTDEARLRLLREAKQILMGVRLGSYPQRELQYLIAVCWNRGVHHVRFGRPAEGHPFMTLARELLPFSPVCESHYKETMEEGMSKLGGPPPPLGNSTAT